MLSVYLKNFKNRLWIIDLQENILENFYFLKIYLSYTYVKSYLSPHRECFFFLLIVTFGKFSAAYEALTDCAVCTPARVTTGVEDEIFKCFPLTGPVYTYQG